MFEGGTPLNWSIDPVEALRRWPVDRRAALLHSGRHDRHWSRWSLLAEPVGTFRVTADRRSVWLGPPEHRPPVAFTHRPFADLRRILNACPGIWVGYLSYDLGRCIEKLPRDDADERRWPLVELGYCPGYAVHDTLPGRWRALGSWSGKPVPEPAGAYPAGRSWRSGPPRSVFTREGYEAAVTAALAYIAAGDAFQINLSQRFTAPFEGVMPHATRALFAQLAAVSPAWYGAYVECGADDAGAVCGRVLSSISPELFLMVHAGGRVTTRPIKGTRPAHVDPEVLRTSPKDTAELNMIVDLLRNDLGRVCRYGSLRVVEPRRIETHPTVHHGVATIEGLLHPSKDTVDLIRAAMPGGSVTGAPKVRAMQIIDELEPVRRGPYCGAIGVLSKEQSCLNIAIRTMLVDPARHLLDYSVGGGIVSDSDPAAEYQETLDKAAAIREVLAVGSLQDRLVNAGGAGGAGGAA